MSTRIPVETHSHTRVTYPHAGSLCVSFSQGESAQVLYPMRTGNHYRMVWTTGSGTNASGGMVLENHEYMLFRYGELKVITGGGGGPAVQTATCGEAGEGEEDKERKHGERRRPRRKRTMASLRERSDKGQEVGEEH